MVPPPAVHIREDQSGPVVVLRLVGEVREPGPMVRLARDLLAARVDGGHVVLDLDGLEVRDAAALSALLTRLAASTGGVPVPTVVSDPAVRRLLRACGSGAAGLACFPTVEEAASVARPDQRPMTSGRSA